MIHIGSGCVLYHSFASVLCLQVRKNFGHQELRGLMPVYSDRFRIEEVKVDAKVNRFLDEKHAYVFLECGCFQGNDTR